MQNNMKNSLIQIFEAALKAVRPDEALMSHLKVDGNELYANGQSYDLSQGRIKVVGAGKGAAPLAQALENLLGNKIEKGLIVVKKDHALPLNKIKIIEASHPVPDENGKRGAEQILEIASDCTNNDLLIVLVTGGASALLPAPAHGLDLKDLQETTQALLASGASIGEVNSIRKHLSAISGGQLAKAANGAKILSIIVSDVIGDDLGAIASGPTFPDNSTFNDCIKILDKYELKNKIPLKVLEILQKGATGRIPETPKADAPYFKNVNNIIVASNYQALQAAARKAEELGFNAEIIKSPMEGEAKATARQLIDYAKTRIQIVKERKIPICLLAGGETTVTITGNGKGGRNQEMALAANIELNEIEGIGCLFAGTDGTDGPTDAAGGFAYGNNISRLGGMDKAKKELADNNSYEALKKAGELFVTGPTRTNVMDIAIILIEK